ncbi:MAG: hypothetical protein D6737_15780 [Chloroflexi bacterium]|nr:MAG: hypothetical protein CUN54_01010 [Phototrophicales bacterium]RMF78143.1 MAG: hypothetical protein D6737_15780 [Chloroflexota bacterium]
MTQGTSQANANLWIIIVRIILLDCNINDFVDRLCADKASNNRGTRNPANHFLSNNEQHGDNIIWTTQN